MNSGAAGRATEDGAGSCWGHAAPADHPTLTADESDERPVSSRLGDGMGQGQSINSMSGFLSFVFVFAYWASLYRHCFFLFVGERDYEDLYLGMWH